MKNKLWFGTYKGRYETDEPVFYPASEVPLITDLENNYGQLRNELKILWENNSNLMEQYGNYTAYDDKQFPPNSWKKIVFMAWGIRNKAVCSKFPFTTALINKYPGITSAYVTRTSASSIIKPHNGETNAHLRVHLGLMVPTSDSSVCGMEVGGQTTGWQNGKAFAFLDAHRHHVWNNSGADRYILIIDILRPQFEKQRNFVCARVIVSQIQFMISRKMKSRYMYETPTRFLNVMSYLLYLPITVAIKLNNQFGFVKL